MKGQALLEDILSVQRQKAPNVVLAESELYCNVC